MLNEPLTQEQVRILGVLVEKQLTTPQQYPLSENALLTGCNQSTNRDPVVTYDTSVVRPALIRLRERELAKRVKRIGERTEKHEHRLDHQLGIEVAPLAVLTVLMLRGPQTPGELKTRTQRMHPFESVEQIEQVLNELVDRGLTHSLPRRAGEKQARWRHRLCGDEDATGARDASDTAAAGLGNYANPGVAVRPGVDVGQRPVTGAAPVSTDVGAAAVSAGEGAPVAPLPTMRELVEMVASLTARVQTLESELGLGSDALSDDVEHDRAGRPPSEPAVEDGGAEHDRWVTDSQPSAPPLGQESPVRWPG